ncbi:MAG TPA: hypothetical protein VEY94_03205 [Patescibacteria group bacterium]|nr:hypothetical protein [Casimicrobiaceae bacterium]HYK63930.1 hypothetical protein [Patescibacteria group bacterium]
MNTETSIGVVRVPRAVPVIRAFAWYEEAMRLFKRAPLNWCLLGLITLAAELLLQLVPGIGVAASKVIIPVIECGMLIGAAAVDRGEPLELRYAVAAFGARAAALAAIVVSALIVFGAEAITGYAVAGVNLLAPGGEDIELSTSTMGAMFTVGTLASLPVLFVPFAALFDHASFGHAFVTSAHGFALNVLPLLVFGVLALMLIVVGLLSFGIALIAILPLLSAASYVAWKDIYGLTSPPG